MVLLSLRSALCGHRKLRQVKFNLSTWRLEVSISRPPKFMFGPKTPTRLMWRRAARTTHQVTCRSDPHTHRVMCHRGKYTEPLHSMNRPDQYTQRTQRSEHTLIDRRRTPPLLLQNLYRGRPPLCHTTVVSVV